MRDFLLFIASLAGAAILTALAIMIRPESPFWKFVLWGGIGIFVACACVLLIDYTRPNEPKALLGGIGVGIALVIGCAIAVVFRNPPPDGEYPAPSSVPSLPVTQQPIRFVVECEQRWPPGIIHAGETYVEMQIYHGERGGVASMHTDVDMPSGHETDPIALIRLSMPWKCTVTYYGTSSLVNITLPVHLVFRRSISTSTGYEGRDTTLVTDWEVPISRIDPAGGKWTFYFYMFNISQDFVHFNFSGYAIARRIESSVSEKIEVIWPYKHTEGFFLTPDPRAMKQPSTP
ncbi:MAG: hypothetical protein ACT4O2_03715 [Beijerinckiaceae bacterium]